MKKFIQVISILFIIQLSFAQNTPLTPDLVVKGGYLNFNINSQPEKIKGVVNFKISKETILNNIKTFIFQNKCESSESDNRILFSIKNIPVGSEYVETPVGYFQRSKSEISFLIIIDINDSSYSYQVKEIETNRSLERIEVENLLLAPQKDLDTLKNIGFNIENITIIGIDIPTKGEYYSVHKKRVAAMIANRNGYVNKCIKEAKTVYRLKSRWIDNINEYDQTIKSEIQLLEEEYSAVWNFMNSMNIKILEE
jgi:hypothetical protein